MAAEIVFYAKPSSLFRYRGLGDDADQEIEALLQGYLYCPQFSAMNDPMEGAHRLSKRFAGGSGGEKRQSEVMRMISRTGIASFSEVHDHEPMWAHYAGKFTGMCVRYNVNSLLRGLPRGVALTRMTYSEHEPLLLHDLRSNSDRARHCLSSKTVRWASEREWRVFRSEAGPADYGEERPVKGIYLGSRISAADERRLMDVGRQLDVPIWKMAVERYSVQLGKLFVPRPKPRARKPGTI